MILHLYTICATDSSTLSIWSIILTIFFGILALFGVKIVLPKAYKWRKIYRESITEDLRKDYLNNKIYLQPYITTTPPQKSHEPKNTKLENKELLRDFFINKVFIKESNENDTVFFLFGDSGTGKTAALVHLFDDYIKKHNAFNLPFNIRLISLRREDSLNEITNIPNEERKKLILLLDAMDETPEVNDPTQLDGFLNKLKTTFLDFARIVITCRPQFFPDDVRQELITHPQGIRTSTGFLECSIKYLAPFDNQQIQEYLDKAITLRSEDPRRREAEKIVNMQPAIAIRPLVLSYIKEIVDANRPVNTTLDLFDTIIYSILKRDIKKTLGQKNLEEKITQWWKASSKVARYMYNHKRLTITDTELDKILQSDIDKSFKQRSLLTRYKDEYHFSHKSFYEYFMAHRFFFYPHEIEQVYGMDFALQLFDELYDAYCNKQTIRFANFQKTTNHSVAYSLSKIGVGLSKINHFSQAETKFQHALTIHRQLAKDNPDANQSNLALTLSNLAKLHTKTNRHKEAEEEYNEALTINRQLAKDNPDANQSNLALTLSNLADLHRKTNRLQKAEEEYIEALTISRQFDMSHGAITLSNLAYLHRKTNRLQEAEKEYNEALAILRQLAIINPDTYRHNVAMTLDNLAKLHRKTNRHQEAEEEYNEALTIYRQLADNNPDAYLPAVADTLNNLANLHKVTNRHQEAEEEYNEALTFLRQLAKDNPDAYLPNVATALNNLASLHRKTNRLQEAEVEYNEALALNRQLAKDNPDAYLPNVATTLSNMAELHRIINRIQEAEEDYNEALSIRRQLAKDNPDAYLPNVAITLYNMAWMYLDRKEFAKAEDAAQESLEIFRIMAEKSPEAFNPWVKRAEELLERIRKAKEKAE